VRNHDPYYDSRYSAICPRGIFPVAAAFLTRRFAVCNVTACCEAGRGRLLLGRTCASASVGFMRDAVPVIIVPGSVSIQKMARVGAATMFLRLLIHAEVTRQDMDC
jgi:hypothetical protein